ncbi:flagellar export chaperone FliS [Robertmurraya kyonggiensis]|uniref:Flagellar secretion chaperone FliS n=1 Tax=Robertmurraya kyonggiensis TaxID=1037680 RepID=A0A4U1D4C9_9BACI|nr:flagellar export chaperone FliS [Robertmurraya kyonggiensis]TKC17044.1 flagellar export chaperone FliS [Robertmurraya kyonggiensis]
MEVTNPYQQYQNNSVNTASPGELTLMLYNGCLKFINLAKKAMVEKNVAEKNINVQKAQNIITELMITLNKDVEISQNLLSLYDYLNRRLIEANVKNDVAILSEVEEFVVEFRDTWKQVIQMIRQRQHAGNGGKA